MGFQALQHLLVRTASFTEFHPALLLLLPIFGTRADFLTAPAPTSSADLMDDSVINMDDKIAGFKVPEIRNKGSEFRSAIRTSRFEIVGYGSGRIVTEDVIFCIYRQLKVGKLKTAREIAGANQIRGQRVIVFAQNLLDPFGHALGAHNDLRFALRT